MPPRELVPSRATKVALFVVLPSLGALFTGVVGRVQGVYEFGLFAAVAILGLCGVSALAFTGSSRRSALVKLVWALVTGTFVGFVWAGRIGFARMVGAPDAELFASGPTGLEAVSAHTRAFFTGLGVATIAFWVFVAALGWAYRRERRHRVDRRRRARAAWRLGSV